MNFWTLLTWVSRKEKMIHSRIHKKSETNNGRIGMGPRHWSGVSRGKIGKYFVRLKICCCRNDSSRQETGDTAPSVRVCVLGILSHVDTLHPALLTTVSGELCYNVLCSRIKVSNYSTIFGCLLSLSYLRWHYYESAKTAQFLMEGPPIYKKKCLKRKCYKTFACRHVLVQI